MLQTIMLATGIVTNNPEPFTIDGRFGLSVITWGLLVIIAFFIKRWINCIDKKFEESKKLHQQCRDELPDKYAKIGITSELRKVSDKVVEHSEQIKNVQRLQNKINDH